MYKFTMIVLICFVPGVAQNEIGMLDDIAMVWIRPFLWLALGLRNLDMFDKFVLWEIRSTLSQEYDTFEKHEIWYWAEQGITFAFNAFVFDMRNLLRQRSLTAIALVFSIVWCGKSWTAAALAKFLCGTKPVNVSLIGKIWRKLFRAKITVLLSSFFF